MIVCLLRLVVRTSGFHPDNSSSILLGDVTKIKGLYEPLYFCLRVFCLLAAARIFASQKPQKLCSVTS